jgi:hypothetical protein
VKYVARVYVATEWSFFTKADHFLDYAFQSDESLEVLAKRLARDGMRVSQGTKWIMPGAILSVEIDE